MSKRDEKLAHYREFVTQHNIIIDDELLVKVTIGLGPSIYNKNAELIACSKPDELNTIKENFLKKKLGLTLSDEELTQALQDVCKEIGSSVRNKFRAVFYALLVKKFDKADIYA